MNYQGQLGHRIMIIGSGGAGKSTLARQLGDLFGLPVIHLDAEHWQPGWVGTPKDAWQCKVEALAQRDRWIIDGNYGGTLDTRLARAHTVIFLDYPWWLCLRRVLQRVAGYRGRTRPDMGPGCPEQVDAEFLKWICWDFPRHTRPQMLKILAGCEGKRVLIHRSPGETRLLVEAIMQDADPALRTPG